MPSRRAPRWVSWPAKLLWAPTLLAGLWFTLAIDADVDKVEQGTWRVIATMPSPAYWFDDVVGFAIGAALLVLGLVLMIFYFAHPGPGRRLTAIEYPLFTWAAWIFLALAVLATIRVDEPIVELGSGGLDWRFLAYLRTTPADRILAGTSALAGAICWVLSWGFTSGRWVAPETHAR